MRRRQHLADGALGARRAGIHAVAQRPHGQQAQDLAFDIDVGGLVAQRAVRQGADLAQALDQFARRGAAAPDRAGLGEGDAFGLELGHAERPALAFLAQQPVGRHADLVQKDLVVFVLVARHVDDRPHPEAGTVHVDQELRQALMLGQVRVGAGNQHADLRLVCQRRPDLVALDDVVIAVAPGDGAQGAEVGAARRLAEQHAPQFLAGERRRQQCVSKDWAQLLMATGLRGGTTPARLISSSMMSCSSGSAERPQGLGQCGTT